MKLEEAINILKAMYKETKFEESEKRIAIEVVLKTVKDSIPKEVVKKKIKELKRMRDTAIVDNAYNIFNGEMIVLQDLLGDE